MKSAQSGDTIMVQPGTYSGMVFKYLTFQEGVTITSVDPTQKAVFTDFIVNKCVGLNFTDVEFSAKPGASYSFTFNDSSNVTFDKVYVHGSLDGDAGNDSGGLSFLNTSNITITNSEFEQLRQAVGVGNGSNITIEGNSAHDLMKTGFVFSGVQDVKVANNTISSIKPIDGQHPDAIQFFTTGTTEASRNIEVTGNLITKGSGDATQGIFFRDQVGTLRYENVTIANNTIVGTGYAGIYAEGMNGLKVYGNELVSDPGKTVATWMLIQNSSNVESSDNKAVQISYDNVTKLTQTSNTITEPVLDQGRAVIAAWSSAAAVEVLAPAPAPAPAPVSAPAPVPPVQPVVTASPTPTKVVVSPDVSPVDTAIINVGKGASDATGDSSDNRIIGNSFANKLMGMAGNDTLESGGGADTLVGGSGDDTYIIPNNLSMLVEKPGEGVDTVIAKGSYTLGDNLENLVINNETTHSWGGTGNGLNNVITGNGGDNRLDGAGGNDTLSGGLGKDQLIGGEGNDLLTGGAGDDTFTFTLNSGHDVITDFGANGDHDKLDIYAYLKAGLAPTVTDNDAGVVISFTTGDSITLLGVHAQDLNPWFAGWVA